MAKGIWWMVLKAQTQLDSQDPNQGTISLADGYAVVPLFRDKKEAEKHSDNGTFQILQVVDVITDEEEYTKNNKTNRRQSLLWSGRI